MSTTGRVPLYEQVKRELREDIARGDYAADRPFVTERMIRERFGVSTTTAVKALNELVYEGVLVRRQGRGTFVAEQRRPAADGSAGTGAGSADGGPVPGPGGRRLTVACVLQHSGGAHVARLLYGVESTCAALGYRMFLSYSGGDPARETAALREAVEWGVAGIVHYPTEGAGSTEALAAVRAAGVPLVMVDRYRPDVPTDAVVADNLTVGRELTAELIRLGHRRIATLWDETECTSVRDRLAGHLAALRDHNLPARPELTVLRRIQDPPPDGSEGPPGTVAALLAAPAPPTVLLCGNGFTLARVVRQLAALGVSTPGAVDLAGMDDVGPHDLLPITAASAQLPSREMGESAVRLLHERIGASDPYREPRRLILPVRIRSRSTSDAHLRVVAGEVETGGADPAERVGGVLGAAGSGAAG